MLVQKVIHFYCERHSKHKYTLWENGEISVLLQSVITVVKGLGEMS